MMQLDYISKSHEYDSSGQATATKVILGNSDGAIVPVFLLPDAINLSNTELYALAMDKHYQENFPQRAEKEKFAELEEALKKADQAIVEMTDLVANIYAKLAEAGIITEEEGND